PASEPATAPKVAPTTETTVTTKVVPITETTETKTVTETKTTVHLSRSAEEVLKLARAKVSDGAIVAFIMNSGSTYNLSVSEILYLREQGVSDFVITTMLDQNRKLNERHRTVSVQSDTTTSAAQTVVMAFTNAVRTGP